MQTITRRIIFYPEWWIMVDKLTLHLGLPYIRGPNKEGSTVLDFHQARHTFFKTRIKAGLCRFPYYFLPLLERTWCCEISLSLFRYRLACSGIDDTNTGPVATATAISTAAADDDEIIVNLVSVLIDPRWTMTLVWQTLSSCVFGGRFELG